MNLLFILNQNLLTVGVDVINDVFLTYSVCSLIKIISIFFQQVLTMLFFFTIIAV